MKQILTAAAMMLLFGCGTYQQTHSETQTPEAKPAVKTSDTVAVLNGRKISRDELEEFLAPALAQIRQQEYQVLSGGLQDYLFMKLQEKKAEEQKIPVEQYYKQNVVDKAGQPAEEEIKKTMEQYRSRLPKDDNQARAKVVEYLQSQKVNEAEQALKKQLLGEADYVMLIQPPRSEVKLTENDPGTGPKDAPVVLVEYSDFECPYCSRVQATVAKVMQEYDGKIYHVFKQLPLQFHKNARFAAEASLCANDQGKFWEMHDWMYKNRSKLNMDGVKEQAKALGMDVDAFAACIEEKKHSGQVDTDLAQAQTLGATATPTFFINGRLLRGAQPYEKFKEVIDQELQFAAQAGE